MSVAIINIFNDDEQEFLSEYDKAILEMAQNLSM